MTAQSKKPVHEAWLEVMDGVQSIAKTDRNQSQNFDFRGIDATVNRVGPALRSARVFVRPRRVLERSEERYETRGGASMRNVTLRIEWEVTGPEGDSFLAETVGEAADAGDKAVTKAHSVALRTFLLQALAVPTGDRDPDADSHERAPTAKPDPRQEWWDRILALAASGGQTPAAVRAHYREKIGHEIDGPEATVESLRGYHDRLVADFERQRAQPKAESPDPWTTPASAAAAVGSPLPFPNGAKFTVKGPVVVHET